MSPPLSLQLPSTPSPTRRLAGNIRLIRMKLSSDPTIKDAAWQLLTFIINERFGSFLIAGPSHPEMKSQAQPTLDYRIISLSRARLRARGARPLGDRVPLGTVTPPPAWGLQVTRAYRPRGGPTGAQFPPRPPQRTSGGTQERHGGQ